MLKGLGKLACRVLAIYIIIKMLPQLQTLILIYGSSVNNLSMLTNYTAIALVLSLAIIGLVVFMLWRYADKIADCMVGDPVVEAENPVNINYDTIQVIAFSVVGLLALVDGIPSLFNSVADIFMFKQFEVPGVITYNRNFMLDMLPRLIGNIVKTALGFWLLLGAKGIKRLISMTRGGIEDK